jgi:hypothetical protein
MLFIQHRVNTAAQLRQTPPEYGVEVDLRDCGDRLVLRHDAFGDGEDFETYLADYRHRLIILNVKSERIEHRVLEAVKRAGVRDYFFLDCSFPMIRTLVAQGERKIAVRFSEFEPVESALALAGLIDWVWVDCFTRMPLSPETHAALKKHFKLCIVSPELQGRSTDTIPAFAAELRPYAVDAVCTKVPEIWKPAATGWAEAEK